MTILETLADFAVNAAPLESGRRAHIMRMVLDNQCAAIAARRTEAGAIALRIASARPSLVGGATVVGGGTVDVNSAAYVNTMLSNALDFEPVGPEGHLLASIVPTVLAAAEVGAYESDRALEAIAVGVEVGARVGLAIRRPAFRANGGKTPAVQGMSSVAIGAAAALCRLLGLRPEVTAHAMAIATYGAPVPLMRRAFEAEAAPTTKYDPLCSHSRAALEAVELASAGAFGDLAAVDGAFGLWRIYGEAGFDTDAAELKLGSHWYLDAEVWWKLYPVVLYSNPIVEAMALLGADRRGDSVDRVEIEHWNPKLGELRTHAERENDAWLSLPINGAMAYLGVGPRPSWRDPLLYSAPAVSAIADLTSVRMVDAERSAKRGDNGLWNGWAPWSVTVAAHGERRRLEGDFLRRFDDDEMRLKWQECLSVLFENPEAKLAAIEQAFSGAASSLMREFRAPRPAANTVNK